MTDAQEALLCHGDALFRYAITRVGDRPTAEDLVQDTLVTAVTKLSSFAGRSSMRTWLVGILRHKILDHYRQLERRPGDRPSRDDPLSPGEADPWFSPSGAWLLDPNVGLDPLDGDPSRELERAQLRATLRACIEALPRSLQRVFVLRELEGLTPQDACATAGISHGSLTVFLYRARQTLRACIQKKWLEP